MAVKMLQIAAPVPRYQQESNLHGHTFYTVQIWRPLFSALHLVLLIWQKGDRSNHASSPSHDLKHFIKHRDSSPCGPTHTCPWMAGGCAQPQPYFCHQCPDQAPHTKIPTLRGTCTIIHTETVGLTLPVLTNLQLRRHSIMT